MLLCAGNELAGPVQAKAADKAAVSVWLLLGCMAFFRQPCSVQCNLNVPAFNSALQVVNWLAQFKPKQLTKQQLVKPILESLCKLCAEPAPEDHDQEDQLSASKFASQVVIAIIISMLSSEILRPS